MLPQVYVDSNRVDAWLSNVLVRGVSELHLSMSLNMDIVDNYRLSKKCLENKKLVKLEICGGIDIGWFDESISLPMLKTLILDSVYVDFEFLLHALPALEELVLVDIIWKRCDVTLSSASLKTLTIDSTIGKTCSFDTPSLVYFYYSDFLAKDYSIAKMDNLVEARINFVVAETEIMQARAANIDLLEEDNDDDVVLLFKNVGKLMNGIRNVQYLNLSADTLEALSLCCETMPLFNNLKLLVIQSHKSRGWQAMPVLLKKCPHLETLIIEGLLHHVTDRCGDVCDCVFREDKGRSLTSCPIKVLEIQEVRGTIKEVLMIKHFLDYFSSLKEIKINIEDNGPMQLVVPNVSEVIVEMMELHGKLSSGNVQLLVNGHLYKKWTAQ